MNEQALKKRLNHLTIAVVIISALILAGGGIASYYLRGMLQNTLTGQMESEVQQYKINIRRQIQADFQTLNTLSSFLQFGNMSTEAFVEGLVTSKQYHNFDRMGYFQTSGTGIRVTIDSKVERNAGIDELNENVQAVVKDAWKGKSGISRIYQPLDDGKAAYAYAVPVYSGQEVAGALTAGVSMDTVTEILQDQSLLKGKGYIHLISDSGEVLVRSEDRVIEKELDTIYEDEFIEPDEQQKIKKALAAGKSCQSEFTYDDVTYQIFLEPLEINGWYLFCVQTARSVNGEVYHMMESTRVVTIVVLLILLFMIIYGYRLIYRSNQSLIKSAYYDPLTGAYNRNKFEQEASKVIEKTPEYSLAAMNIRQFKFINEIFGSQQADHLLCYIKEVIAGHVREGEYFCRGTDDMFYILLRDTDREIIRERLEEMIGEISLHAISVNRDYQILMYCGIVIGTDVSDVRPTVQKSMTHVRFALDTARKSLKKYIWFYDTSLHEDEKLQNYVESHMRQAMENEEFQMYLQPKVDLRTGRISGAEALVRWIPGSGKMIYPGQFIPIFEENGFCVQLDLYMVEKVCRQIRTWMDQGSDPVPLSVNQSKLLFYESDYTDKLKALLEKYQIPARLITLEILEGLAMENIEELNEKIVRLKEIGFQISMDDFGSGYSSLNTLASLKIDELKIDRGFLLRLQDAKEDYRRQVIIMDEVVKLTKKLKIRTVVEGVETEENEKLVQKLDCDYGQGYYYGRPVSAEEFTEKYISMEGDKKSI